MKATLVSLAPSAAATAANRPSLTPELLAACGARYSRNNEGLEAILAKIDPADPDGSTDSIFKMLDYGHASIADMAPVAVFIDGISLFLAYWIWSVCPTASGQESSTRYIRLSPEGLVNPDTVGIADTAGWRSLMGEAFKAYEMLLPEFQRQLDDTPEHLVYQKIPRNVSHAVADRIRRNYAFDRARNMIPLAALTNMMLVMNARGWEELLRCLNAAPWPEARNLSARLRTELSLCIPRMIRHDYNDTYRLVLENTMLHWRACAVRKPPLERGIAESEGGGYLEVFGAPGDMALPLMAHVTRHDYLGQELRRTPVRFGWTAICFAELRDLNRHRTGTKVTDMNPVGFWLDTQNKRTLPRDAMKPQEWYDREEATWGVGDRATRQAYLRLKDNDPSFVYYMLLGTQVAFEHTTTADKFIYEAELRTGAGAHYRYADHLRDVLAIWYQKFPSTRGLVLEGQEEGR